MGLVTKIIQIHSDLLSKFQLISLIPRCRQSLQLDAHRNKCTC